MLSRNELQQQRANDELVGYETFVIKTEKELPKVCLPFLPMFCPLKFPFLRHFSVNDVLSEMKLCKKIYPKIYNS